jgi:hypothetical protein
MVQSLTEMDFERGLWGAALVCDNFDNYLFCDFNKKLERFSAKNSVKRSSFLEKSPLTND